VTQTVFLVQTLQAHLTSYVESAAFNTIHFILPTLRYTNQAATNHLIMSTDSLEQRLYDLLQPYREECYKNAPNTAPAIEEERVLLILCGT